MKIFKNSIFIAVIIGMLSFCTDSIAMFEKTSQIEKENTNQKIAARQAEIKRLEDVEELKKLSEKEREAEVNRREVKVKRLNEEIEELKKEAHRRFIQNAGNSDQETRGESQKEISSIPPTPQIDKKLRLNPPTPPALPKSSSSKVSPMEALKQKTKENQEKRMKEESKKETDDEAEKSKKEAEKAEAERIRLMKKSEEEKKQKLEMAKKEALPSKESINENCSICFDELLPENSVKQTCGHSFHSGCINPWLKNHTTCPNCRAEIKSKDTVKTASETEISKKSMPKKDVQHDRKANKKRHRGRSSGKAGRGRPRKRNKTRSQRNRKQIRRKKQEQIARKTLSKNQKEGYSGARSRPVRSSFVCPLAEKTCQAGNKSCKTHASKNFTCPLAKKTCSKDGVCNLHREKKSIETVSLEENTSEIDTKKESKVDTNQESE